MRPIDADALVYELTEMIRYSTGEYKFGLNAARLAATEAPTIGGWISVKDRLPEEHESIFHKYLGTPIWSSAMWKQESDKVLVCVSFPDGTSVVTTGCLQDSDWVTTVSETIPQTVTHWMPLPEPPMEERRRDE